MNMPEISRRRALAYACALLVLLVVAGRFLVVGGKTAREPAQAPGGSLEVSVEPAPERRLVVHVVGAVLRPGLYRVKEGSRVDDAIRRAGGPKPKAALELVNLAAPVADGQQVVVPARGAAGPAAGPGSVEAGGPSPGARVRLNSATLEDLDALPGIGPVTAQKIIDYRTEHGAFSSVEELDAVPGIGPARLAQLKELVDL
jgi:competence protein ComEA